MKVIFSHGKESGPWGTKIRHLATIAERLGFAVESLDYQEIDDPEERVGLLVNHAKEAEEELIYVGSSMGGYVSLRAAWQVRPKGLFLMAPALFMPGFENRDYPCDLPYVSIVHGWGDDIVPADHSIRYARDSNCTLHLLDGDHRLIDSLHHIGQLFELFLATHDH